MFCLVDVTDFVGFKSSSSRKKQLALSGFEVEFADEECYTISAVFRIQKAFVHKEIRQPN